MDGWQSIMQRSLILEKLRELGGNFDILTHTLGLSPLCIAVANNRVDVCSFLVSQNVDINAGADQTPLFAAAVAGNLQLLKLLIARKADVNLACGYLRNTPLHAAVNAGKFEAVLVLLQAGALVDICNVTGRTPLAIAIHCKHLDIGLELVGFGSNVDTREPDTQATLLHIAAAAGSYSSVKQLIDVHHAALNFALRNSGETPLHLAVAGGFDNVVWFLTNRGADAEKLNSSLQSPKALASPTIARTLQSASPRKFTSSQEAPVCHGSVVASPDRLISVSHKSMVYATHQVEGAIRPLTPTSPQFHKMLSSSPRSDSCSPLRTPITSHDVASTAALAQSPARNEPLSTSTGARTPRTPLSIMPTPSSRPQSPGLLEKVTYSNGLSRLVLNTTLPAPVASSLL
eukprot:TRINITY_DN2669_c0_g1_i2.p1 TRINITY_DN2669_c0_g1~~TRINITY_DN2669_c0_g1_i2.p1  ORF type:complete len:402 (-),score=53.59 TRINITY_DN2669_c0_g1_i2:29-1234(-)